MTSPIGPTPRPPRIPHAGRAELADARRAAAGRAGRADPAAGAVDHPALARAAARASSRPSTRTPTRGSPAAPRRSRPRRRASSSPRASSNWPSQMELGRAGPVDGQQGGGPRARDVPDEDRLPARPDGRASLDRRDLLPRAAGRAGPTSPGTSRSCPSKWPSRGGFLGGEFDAFQVGDPSGKLPDVTSPVPAARELARVRRPRRRRAGLRPRPAGPRRGDAAPRDARPRPRDDDLRAAQGVRRLAGARRASAPSTATPRSAAAAWPPAG